MFSWGSQWYKPLNLDQASTCGSTVEYDSPLIESQAAILSRTFLDWCHEDLAPSTLTLTLILTLTL